MKIISGGQTGVDQVALEVAKAHSIETGGFLPLHCMTDTGPRRDLLETYGMIECLMAGYPHRTRRNVEASHATVWFGVKSPGYRCTKRACAEFDRPFYENPNPGQLAGFLGAMPHFTVNIAGNRLRTHPESANLCRVTLTVAFQLLGMVKTN